MLRRTERNVYVYDLVVAARAKHAPTPKIEEIIGTWEAMLAKGELKNEREKGSVVYRVRKIELDDTKGVATILIGKCDTNVSNVAYSKAKTGVARILEKDEDEGGDKAAHLVMSLVPQKDEPNSYLCFLEGVPGLSHNVVQPLLNAGLRTASGHGIPPFAYEVPLARKTRMGIP